MVCNKIVISVVYLDSRILSKSCKCIRSTNTITSRRDNRDEHDAMGVTVKLVVGLAETRRRIHFLVWPSDR